MFQIVRLCVSGQQNSIDCADFVQMVCFFPPFTIQWTMALSNMIVNLQYIHGWYFGERFSGVPRSKNMDAVFRLCPTTMCGDFPSLSEMW